MNIGSLQGGPVFCPEDRGYSMKIALCGIPPSEIIGQGGPRGPKTTQTTATALYCPLKLDGKIIPLKTQYTLVEEHRGNQTRTNLNSLHIG